MDVLPLRQFAPGRFALNSRRFAPSAWVLTEYAGSASSFALTKAVKRSLTIIKDKLYRVTRKRLVGETSSFLIDTTDKLRFPILMVNSNRGCIAYRLRDIITKRG